MRIILFILAFFSFNSILQSSEVIIQYDNGTPRTQYYERPNWEESIIFQFDGPCEVLEIQIYYTGTTSAKDTVYIVGDPAEGTVPPTFWVLHYNQRINPIIVNYDGKAGWRFLPVSNLRSDGYDRICIQHRVKSGGPWWAVDNNGASVPYRSFTMNPAETNQLGGPGKYYIADGDYLVRLKVKYDFPKGNSSEPPPIPVLMDVTKSAGLVDANGNFIRSADVSVVDFNGDGYDDIVIGSNFFENQKDGTFKNVSSRIKISAGATSWGDFDNDGKIDCYAQVNGTFDRDKLMVLSRDKVYRNNGDGTFTPIDPKTMFKLPYPSPSIDFNSSPKGPQDSIFNPYSNITPLWFDYNGDGWLDLYLANNRTGYNDASGNYREIYYPDQLWKNDGSGKFTNERKNAGIDIAEPLGQSGYHDCYGANACDYNQDGKIDIFVATYRLVRDILYHNYGDGTFEDVAAQTGVRGVPTAAEGYFGHGMGSEWGDFNNDGYPDLCVGNLGHPDWRGMYSNPSLIFKNSGPPNYKFEEMHQQMGLKFFEMNAGVCWVDLNLDGYLDLVHGQISYDAKGKGVDRLTRVYLNEGPTKNFKLKDITWHSGAIIHGAWTPVRIDYDNDGDMDLLIASSQEHVKLFRNDFNRDGNWVTFKLIGSPNDGVNMDAYGSKILIESQGKKFYRELMGSISGNRCSQNSSEIHFGLGNIDKIEKVTITYPNGKQNTITNLKPNKKYLVRYLNSPSQRIMTAPQQYFPPNYSTHLPKTNIDFKFYSTGVTLYRIEYFKKVKDSLQNHSTIVFLSGVPDEPIQQTRYTREFDCGTYYWRVKAYDADSAISDFWVFTVCAPKPLAPQLKIPENGSKNVSAKTSFEWLPAQYETQTNAETEYILQIYLKDNPNEPVFVSEPIKELKYQLNEPLQPGQTYIWRVRGKNEDVLGDYSEFWEFTTMPLPNEPKLLLPEDEAINVDLKPRFRWERVENATGYHLQISRDSEFNDIAYEKDDIVWISYNLPIELEIGKTYWWRLRAYNDGGYGKWSDKFSFTTTTQVNVNYLNEEQLNFEIIPNPATFNKVRIKIFNSVMEPYFLVIYNIFGEQVHKFAQTNLQEKFEEIEISTEQFSSGIYFIKLENGSTSITKKLLLYK